VAALFDEIGGPELAVEAVRRRAGSHLDPAVADEFCRSGPAILAEIASLDPCEALLDAEPEPARRVSGADVDTVASAFGDVVDLKAPFLHGHSSGVAELAGTAGEELGLDGASLRLAGFLHDIGRVAVPSGIWEKQGPLTVSEWEQVRLHAYQSERILARSPALVQLAPLVGMHHERLDGSGYHRQAAGKGIPVEARVLAAADVYQAMTQERPYRPALSPEEAADELATEGRAGRLDPEAVAAVIAAAGHARRRSRRAWPADLTDREVEVLRLLAQGCANKEIARRLWISTKTAGHHVQHIYAKIGVSSRAAAALFAMEHDLVER
jgi:DNA-binding CsgD family transcriptional regulator